MVMEEQHVFFKEGLLTEEQAVKMCEEAKAHHKKLDKKLIDKRIKPFLDLFGRVDD